MSIRKIKRDLSLATRAGDSKEIVNKINEIISNLTNGATQVESGSFSRTALEGTGDQVITTTKKPKVIFFNAKKTGAGAAPGYCSDGRSDNTNQSCIQTIYVVATASSITLSKQNQCINVSEDGYAATQTAVTSAFNDTSFTLTWSQSAGGVDVDVQWQAIY